MMPIRVTRCALAGMLLLAGGCRLAERLEPGARSSALASHQVAAIQYASGQAGLVLESCTTAPKPDACAVQELVKQARQKGAILVVAPELALDQPYISNIEPTPALGSNPGIDPSWPAGGVYIKMFSQQAQQLGITIVIHLLTQSATSKPYSTQIAFGPDGRVLGKHHKFELFSAEKNAYTAGTDVEVFESAQLGKVGLLICADIYGDLNLHQKLVETLKARVVAFSSFWTAPGAANFQQSYARNWGVWMIGSNVSGGAGRGGGIFDPEGKELARTEQASPSLLVASIPSP